MTIEDIRLLSRGMELVVKEEVSPAARMEYPTP